MTPSQRMEAMAVEHGWDNDDARRCVATAPPPPDDALELLRAGGFPLTAQNRTNQEKAS